MKERARATLRIGEQKDHIQRKSNVWSTTVFVAFCFANEINAIGGASALDSDKGGIALRLLAVF